MIDTPRWPWRGHLWAHMISDHSLDELHEAARELGLRWVAFGRDHYDVPDTRWEHACEVADLVDSREIVRSLRRTGLRVPGGKPQKSWNVAGRLPARLDTPQVRHWLLEAERDMPDATIEVLTRPTEWLVMHLRKGPQPASPHLAQSPSHASRVVETLADGRYSLELILPEP